MSSINDYDHYAALRQKELKAGEKLPHRFVEKPAMKQLLPNLNGKKVLMLGCGTGEESTMLTDFGATTLVGVDLSAESIRLAKESYPPHEFLTADMHNLPFEDSSFDFAYSSLTIHYSKTPVEVYKEIHRVLKPGGVLQFSVGHPMRWASERIDIEGVTTKVLGFSENKDVPRLYGSYSSFQEYDETFPSGETLRFWIGPPSIHFNLLVKSGFAVEKFIETKAVDECKDVDRYYYERFSQFPQFTVFSARKLPEKPDLFN